MEKLELNADLRISSGAEEDPTANIGEVNLSMWVLTQGEARTPLWSQLELEQSLELGRDLQAHVDEPLRLEFTFTLPAELDRKPLGELSDWLEETGRGGTATALNGLIGGAVGALTEAAGASPGTKDPLPGMERRGDVEYELRNPEGDPRYGAVWLVEVQCDVGALELTGAERVRVVHPAE